MSKPLSFSGYNRYVTCAYSHKLHYQDRIRPVSTPAHLIFGKACDEGFNAILLESGSPMEAVDKVLRELVTTDVEFIKADYDGEIIDADVKEIVLDKCRTLGYKGDDLDVLIESLFSKPRADLSDAQRKALTLACAASLRAKATLFIEAYKTRVSPRLRKIEAVQSEIKWTDHNDNDFVGVIDLMGEFEGIEGVHVIDNKTASRPYENDAVKVSTQLALYAAKTGVTKAAFIVLDKNIKKNRIKTCSVCKHVGNGRHKTCDKETPDERRCGGEWIETIRPEVNIQILIDEVSKHVQDITVEAMSNVAEAIKGKHFPRNLNACGKQYGKPCPYINLCWKNSMDGLEVKPEEPSDD